MKMNYNGTTYNVEVLTYYGGMSLGIIGTDEVDSDNYEMFTLNPTIPPQDETYIVLNNERYLGIENVLIDNGVIESELEEVIKINNVSYPVYKLTDKAVEEYEQLNDVPS